jgi:ABC-type glycerol-3-phosphate transport system substrate-binding protein
MAQVWDDTIKRLIRENPQDFISWVLEPAALLGLAKAFAALVFTDEADKKWLERIFAVYKNILDDSWAVQEWKKEALAQGLAEGEIKASRQILLSVFQARFPEAVPAIRKKIDAINDAELLQQLTVKTSMAQTSEEALEALFTMHHRQEPSSSKENGHA